MRNELLGLTKIAADLNDAKDIAALCAPQQSTSPSSSAEETTPSLSDALLAFLTMCSKLPDSDPLKIAAIKEVIYC